MPTISANNVRIKIATGTISTNSTFIGLTDTPVDYTGFSGQAAIVNPTETGLEFGTITQFLISTLSDIASPTYYYYGGIDGSGNWKINRYLRTDVNTQDSATEVNNPAFTDLATAWANRLTLIYA